MSYDAIGYFMPKWVFYYEKSSPVIFYNLLSAFAHLVKIFYGLLDNSAVESLASAVDLFF